MLSLRPDGLYTHCYYAIRAASSRSNQPGPDHSPRNRLNMHVSLSVTEHGLHYVDLVGIRRSRDTSDDLVLLGRQLEPPKREYCVRRDCEHAMPMYVCTRVNKHACTRVNESACIGVTEHACTRVDEQASSKSGLRIRNSNDSQWDAGDNVLEPEFERAHPRLRVRNNYDPEWNSIHGISWLSNSCWARGRDI